MTSLPEWEILPQGRQLNSVLTFVKLDASAYAPIKAHQSDVGWDLSLLHTVVLEQGRSAWGRTGLVVIPPDGYYCRILHRSSTFDTYHVMVREGTIDPGFRGELLIALWRPTGSDWTPTIELRAGTRIAQLILAPAVNVECRITDGPIVDTDRGTAGFGSTG